ncbi:SDR family oxidoreductase [Candidatus Micrarchaeota archaeon]|nr:SDR family oxidoreductase [Candidatus Micrarchaeota archaeon]
MKALITGGGRGIGLAIARKFAENGIDLIIIGRNAKTLETARKELGKKVNVQSFVCDVSDDSQIKELMEKADGFDILVNNAGVLGYREFADSPAEEIDYMLDINLRGLMMFTKAAIPKMKKGVIINIASGAGKSGYPKMAVYCATKFGVIGFTESLAMELKDIKVFSVCPSDTQTEMWSSRFERPATYQPEDVAGVVWKVFENADTIRPGSAIDVTFELTDLRKFRFLRN